MHPPRPPSGALWGALALWLAFRAAPVAGQAYGEPDRSEPGDLAIQGHLAREADRIHGSGLESVLGIEGAGREGAPSAAEAWGARRGGYREEYLHMLGLSPLPAKTPLEATVTRTREGDGFVVDNLHYQSRPRLYVTANLYRPSAAGEGERLPAVLYVCGHSSRGRSGNKTAFQSHGIWFARHGYVCLVVDTLQLGEIAATHHGTYREGRWWWHSRGYTPAGVECWNGVRGIDYLVSRPDVDPERIAVTGISGGGAATFWIAAADERVRAAVPVSGMADLPSYVGNRVVNGHCDCMFLYNTFQWPWARIAALVAPRPLLFTNSDLDPIFPMDANERLASRIERVYSLFGAGDAADSFVSIGGHAYRRDIRQAAYRFINTHLKGDPRPVLDSEVDLVEDAGGERAHPIPPEELRVFREDADLPADELNTTIDQHFVPLARVEAPAAGGFEAWKRGLLVELRRVTFRALPARVPPARRVEGAGGEEAPAAGFGQPESLLLETEPGIAVELRRAGGAAARTERVLLAVLGEGGEDGGDGDGGPPGWIEALRRPGDAVWVLAPRGTGEGRWTRRSPPNYVARSHVLLGRTVDGGRVLDVVSAARHLKAAAGAPVWVGGAGAAGVVAGAAALLEEEDIAGALVIEPPASYMEAGAPVFLNVLRVLDVAETLGLLAPRPLVLRGGPPALRERVAALYQAAGAPGGLDVR